MQNHANDNQDAVSDALQCAPCDLERARAWILVELAADDVDVQPLIADLGVCDARISTHRIRSLRLNPKLRAISNDLY